MYMHTPSIGTQQTAKEIKGEPIENSTLLRTSRISNKRRGRHSEVSLLPTGPMNHACVYFLYTRISGVVRVWNDTVDLEIIQSEAWRLVKTFFFWMSTQDFKAKQYLIHTDLLLNMRAGEMHSWRKTMVLNYPWGQVGCAAIDTMTQVTLRKESI